ncbi:MAG: TolC family protein, partial [Acidobacteriota bacterium]|nr:TolC family protein [Acidobacteriota bacterium]
MKAKTALFGAIVLLAVAGRAQQTTAAAPAVMPLSLDEAVRRGLANGEETRISASRIADARQQVRIAQSAAWPQVTTQVSYGRTIYTPFDFSSFPLPAGVVFPFGQKNTWNASLNVNQLLFDGGIVRSGIAIAKQAALIADARGVEDRAQVELGIIEAYYGAVLAERSADIMEATEEQLDAQLNHVKLLNQAGNASDLEVLRVTVLRENVEPQRIEVLNSRDLALLNLKRIINLDVPIRLTDGLAVATLRRLDDAEIDEMLRQSIDHRGVIHAAERGVAVLEEQVRITQAAFLPAVAFNLRLNEQ